MSVQIITGDCRAELAKLADESVNCVVTSPPYWGLRDYGVDGQIGLEASVAEHISILRDVFREVRRVLRKDGTLWINYGDAYAGGGKGGNPPDSPHQKQATNKGSLLHAGLHETARQHGVVDRSWQKPPEGLKAKDLIGLPWRLAFALQEDGWYLRQDIIWSKPNPMPESVSDRCTKAHEYIFLLSRSPRYHYDAEAVLEPCSPNTHARLAQNVQDQVGSERAHAGGKTNGRMKAVARTVGVGSNARPRKAAPNGSGTKNNASFDEAMAIMPTMRNKRSVWEVPSLGFSEAHFATFPPGLIEPCILAGCPEGGTVLDPFGGAGTTGMVADRLQRNAILIELNPAYAEIARNRIFKDAGMFAEIAS